jgi:transposase
MESGKKRQKHSDEFKAGAVRLVLEEGRSPTAVARDLGVHQSNIFKWLKQARANRGEGKPGELTSDERARLKQLEKEVRILREERTILKKAAAFFAKENS